MKYFNLFVYIFYFVYSKSLFESKLLYSGYKDLFYISQYGHEFSYGICVWVY